MVIFVPWKGFSSLLSYLPNITSIQQMFLLFLLLQPQAGAFSYQTEKQN